MTEAQKNSLVVQSNKLIEARYSLTLQEQRIVLIMISMIDKGDKDFKEYNIKISDFIKLVGIKNKNIYREIKGVLRSLDKKRFSIEDGKDYILTGWTSSVRYTHEEGMITLCFDPILKPYLLDIKSKFTSQKLGIALSFKVPYSFRLYSLLKQYERIGERTIGIDELKQMLDMKKDKYKVYQDFKKRVIIPVQDEMNKKDDKGSYISDLGFDFSSVKTGRKITSLKFTIIKHKPDDSINEIQLDDFETKQEYLKAYNVSPSMIEALSKNHTKGEIEKCIDIFEKRKKSGQVKVEGSGLLISLIQNGAGLPSVDEKKAQDKVQQEQQEAVEKEKEKLALEYSKVAKQNFFDSLSEEEEKKILDNFLKQYERQAFYIDRLKNDGIRSMLLGGEIIKLIPKYEQKKQAYISKKIKEKYSGTTL